MAQFGTGRARRELGTLRDTMKNTTSRLLFAYWDRVRGDRSAPERSQIEPGAIRHILADMFVLELGAGRPTFRLAGTRLCLLFGRELRGSPFDSIWGEPEPGLEGLLEAVTGDTAGVVAGLVATNGREDTLPLELVLLPLRHGGNTGTRVLGALSSATVPHWIGAEPLVQLSTASVRVLWPDRRAPLAALPPPRISAAERRRGLVVLKGGLA